MTSLLKIPPSEFVIVMLPFTPISISPLLLMAYGAVMKFLIPSMIILSWAKTNNFPPLSISIPIWAPEPILSVALRKGKVPQPFNTEPFLLLTCLAAAVLPIELSGIVTVAELEIVTLSLAVGIQLHCPAGKDDLNHFPGSFQLPFPTCQRSSAAETCKKLIPISKILK